MADSLLLDASLLLHAPTASAVRYVLQEELVPAEGEVAVPDTMYRVASGEFDYYEQIAPAYRGRGPSAMSTPDDLAWITETEIRSYPVFPDAFDRVPDVDDALQVFTDLTDGNLTLARLLTEEWAFLMTGSWIAARKHTTFNFFKRGGAVAIELPRQAFDELTKRTLRIPTVPVPRPLKQSERLRAVTKWAAAGGAPWAAELDPLLGIFASSVAGFFLLFDP